MSSVPGAQSPVRRGPESPESLAVSPGDRHRRRTSHQRHISGDCKMLPSFLQTKKWGLALSFSVHVSLLATLAQSPVLRLTLDWIVIVHCHVCQDMWPYHYSCSCFLTVETTQKTSLYFTCCLFFINFVRWQFHTCVYNECVPVALPHSPLSSPVHMCCLYLPVISFPHACLFVLWLADFSQSHLCDYRLCTDHWSLVDSLCGTQLKAMPVSSPESISSQ